jgi:hypothetical protein
MMRPKSVAEFDGIDTVLMELVRLGYRRRTGRILDLADTWDVDGDHLWIYPDLGEHAGAVYLRVAHQAGVIRGPWHYLEAYSGQGDWVIDAGVKLDEIAHVGGAWIRSWPK